MAGIITRIFRNVFSARNSPKHTANNEQIFAPPPDQMMPETISIPAELVGYEKHESRRNPGRYYYMNLLPAPLPNLPQIRSKGFFPYEVRSAFYYQSELELAAWGRRELPIVFRTNCILRAKPDNPHDRHAIEVLIGGARCGHIGRADNQQFANELRALGIVGDVQCRAKITAGETGAFHLSLDLDFPLSVLSTDRRPTSKPPRKK
jgi:hypothetical protein